MEKTPWTYSTAQDIHIYNIHICLFFNMKDKGAGQKKKISKAKRVFLFQKEAHFLFFYLTNKYDKKETLINVSPSPQI